MKPKPIQDFTGRFGASFSFDENLIVQKENRYFLVNEGLRQYVQTDFFYAGAYLGKVKDGILFPSFILLAMMAAGKANKITVDEKTAWLFVCGRDVFKQGILKTVGSMRKGDYTLVLNRYDECLGFGRLLHSLTEVKDGNKVVVRNISDIGDFLRREK